MRKSEKKYQAYEFHLQEYSYQEIADELGVSKTTAYRWVTEQQNSRDTGSKGNNNTKKTEFVTEALRLKTSLATNNYDNVTKQHINDNNLQEIPTVATSEYDIELKKAEMEHDYRMAQVKLEEKRLENNNSVLEGPIIKSNTPKDAIIKSNIPDKLPESKKEDSYTAISRRIIDDFNRKMEENAKAVVKRKEDKRQVELLKEKAKYLIPQHLRLSMEDLIRDYLELNNKPIKKAQANQFSQRITNIISELKTLAKLRVAKVEKYSIWETVIQIETDFGTVLSEINKSFFGNPIIEIDAEWAKELESVTFE